MSSHALGLWPASAGFLARVPELSVIFVGGTLAMQGTSSSRPKRFWGEIHPAVSYTEARHSSADQLDMLGVQSAEVRDSARRAVIELRRMSGLTWEQLGSLFEVSRRSVHFWASGNPLSSANEERLMRVLQVVRGAYRGDAHSTRAALMTPVGGVVPFDLLVTRRYDEARQVLGTTASGTTAAARPRLSAAAERSRRPLEPGEIVDALHEPVHRQSGKGRSVRTIRNSRRERDA